ncbi:MAG: hypothetical protein GYA02_17145 [Clostridiaceae bacterium]|nr:hypothetical protein [Clostridiaceae bacterium]
MKKDICGINTRLRESSAADFKVKITQSACNLCYEIFGKRTEAQCLKCKSN